MLTCCVVIAAAGISLATAQNGMLRRVYSALFMGKVVVVYILVHPGYKVPSLYFRLMEYGDEARYAETRPTCSAVVVLPRCPYAINKC